MKEWMDGRMDGWKIGWMEKWMDGKVAVIHISAVE